MSAVWQTKLFWKILVIPVAGIALASVIAIGLAYVTSDVMHRSIWTALARFSVLAATAVVFWHYWRDHAGIAATGTTAEPGKPPLRPTCVAFIAFVALNDSTLIELLSLKSFGARVSADFALIATSFVLAYLLYEQLVVVDTNQAAARDGSADGGMSP